MTRNPLYGCLPEISSNGDLYVSEDMEVILQSIYVILVTLPGTRPWQPDFGCLLLTHIWDIMTKETTSTIQDEVVEALTKWEPRIKVLSAICTSSKTKLGGDQINLTIEFQYKDETYSHTYNVSTKEASLTDISIYSLKKENWKNAANS